MVIVIANDVVINRSIKKFGWRLRYGDEFSIGFLLIPTVKGRCLTLKPIIKGRDLGIHTTTCFEGNVISSHLTIESSRNIHKLIARVDLNTIMRTFQEDVGRFRSRWLERYDLNEKVIVPTNEFINHLWKMIDEFIKFKNKRLYIDFDTKKIESVVDILGVNRVLTIESLLGAIRRFLSWVRAHWKTFYSPDQRLVILENDRGTFEAYAFKPEFIDIWRSITEVKLHPEEFLKLLEKIFGKSIEILMEIFGFKTLLIELWERGLL